MTDFLKVDGANIDLQTALQWRLALSDDDFIDETVTDAAIVHHCRSKNIAASVEDIQTVFSELRMPENWKVPMRQKLDEDVWY